ncbi:MAG: hypothetical protein LBW85_10860 [Deltaproteobacteria bacterium]|nr:hypothetical protein [Deltaproteobacteria bacterium]
MSGLPLTSRSRRSTARGAPRTFPQARAKETGDREYQAARPRARRAKAAARRRSQARTAPPLPVALW